MEIVRAASIPDFLAMVPALMGFAPQRSVVCVPFSGERTAERVMRVDLPDRRRESGFRNLAGYLIGVRSRLRAVDGSRLSSMPTSTSRPSAASRISTVGVRGLALSGVEC